MIDLKLEPQQTTVNGNSLDYDCGRGHKVSAAPSTCAAWAPILSPPPIQRGLSCTVSQSTHTIAHSCALAFVRPQLVGTNQGS